MKLSLHKFSNQMASSIGFGSVRRFDRIDLMSFVSELSSILESNQIGTFRITLVHAGKNPFRTRVRRTVTMPNTNTPSGRQLNVSVEVR